MENSISLKCSLIKELNEDNKEEKILSLNLFFEGDFSNWIREYIKNPSKSKLHKNILNVLKTLEKKEEKEENDNKI